jgi:crotonobetainyl-CoA:carnitine CoA-transferase CaiB-like acyl-CoA transferase
MIQRLAIIVSALAFAGLLSLTGPPKSIPGGPYVSVIGDVIPTILGSAAIVLGTVSIRKAHGGIQVIVIALSLTAAALLGLVLEGVITFWLDPHAYGRSINF